MKVEKTPKRAAKLPPINIARFRRGSTHSSGPHQSRQSSTLLRLNSVASPAARLMN